VNEHAQKLDEVFHTASALASPDDRRRFLDEACADDPQLRQAVESLLNAAPKGEILFSAWNEGTSKSNAVPVPAGSLPAGSRIGRYKILEKLGEGGMGIVYQAEQESPVRRLVAVKVLKLGMDSRPVIARFEAERQALALMDHPNIARILDGGVIGEGDSVISEAQPQVLDSNPSSPVTSLPHRSYGRPYFVMELVRGIPITEFCEANRLSVAARLRLFIPVCQAIQSAHQKGIIHRDLKPSNVLVTLVAGVAHPVVIDFGVAKATNQERTAEQHVTQFGSMIGTPAYMSPEQADMSQRDIDTRSDIYSLGALLYQLLSGSPPFAEERLRRSSYSEIREMIVEEEPELPSARWRKAGPASLGSRPAALPSDLDWIVMKCLEKDRARRYETAQELAADIQRHLDQEPVAARPPSASYRIGRFILRNQLAFAGAVAVTLTLLAGLVASSWQAARATRAEEAAKQQANLAQQQLEIAQAVKGFLTENLLGQGVSQYHTNAISSESARALLQYAALKLEGQFTNQPLIEAEIRRALALAFVDWVDHTNAILQNERVLEILRPRLGLQHSDTLGAVASLAISKYLVGQRQEARQMLSNAVTEVRRSTNGPSLGAGQVLGMRGWMLQTEGYSAEAVPFRREALAMFQQTVRTNDPWMRTLIHGQGDLAYALEQAGEVQEAERLYRELIEQCERANGPDHATTTRARFVLGRLLIEQQRGDEGLPWVEQAVSYWRQRLGADRTMTLDGQYWLGRAYEQKGEVERAAAIYSEIFPRLLRHWPNRTAEILCPEIAEFQVRHRRYAEAKAAFTEILARREKRPIETEEDFDGLWRASAAVKGWPAAAAVCRTFLEQNPESWSSCLIKAWIFRFTGDDESYQQVVERVWAMPANLMRSGGEHFPLEIAAMNPGRFSAAQWERIEDSMGLLQARLPKLPADQRIWSQRALGQLYLLRGRLEEGLKALEEASPEGAAPDAFTLFLKAIGLHRLGREAEARSAFDQGEAALRSQWPGPLEQLDSFLGFLLPSQIYQQVLMHQEAAAELGRQPSGQ